MKKLIRLLSSSRAGLPKTETPVAKAKTRGYDTNGEVMPGELFKLYEKVLLRPDDIVKKMK